MEDILLTIIQFVIAAVIGGLIGFEREKTGHYAGLRTHIVVCLTGCFMMVVAMSYFSSDSVSRIAAGLVTGIGFIGAGSIISQGDKVKGLTTAASVWAVTGLGIVIGLGAIFEAVIVSIIMLVVLEFKRFKGKPIVKKK